MKNSYWSLWFYIFTIFNAHSYFDHGNESSLWTGILWLSLAICSQIYFSVKEDA
jgi:hypothetical protein